MSYFPPIVASLERDDYCERCFGTGFLTDQTVIDIVCDCLFMKEVADVPETD